MPEATDAVAEVVTALRRYVHANPQACDTVEGIAAWWPLPRAARGSPEVVAAALAALLASGEMECAFGADGHAVYRAGRSAAGKAVQVEPGGS